MNTQEIIITKVFHAPIEKVWEMWTLPERIKQWWGPDHFTCQRAEVDFRIGGRTIVSMEAQALGFPEQFSVWEYTSIAPYEHIEFIHTLADKDGNTVSPQSVGMPADFPDHTIQHISFKDLGGGETEITVIEKNWPQGSSMIPIAELGMKQCLDKMERVL
jgi:uncharacterized protein YndB with AHSA1/START domain